MKNYLNLNYDSAVQNFLTDLEHTLLLCDGSQSQAPSLPRRGDLNN